MSLFKSKKRLTDILATFNETMADLQELADNNKETVGTNEQTIATLEANNVELTTESENAVRVKEKLAALVS